MNDRSKTKSSDRHLPVPELDALPKADAKAGPPKRKSYPILKPHRPEPKVRNIQRTIEDATAFAKQVDLTSTAETQDPSQVEKGFDQKGKKSNARGVRQTDFHAEQSKGAELLSELDALITPKAKPKEITLLERLLPRAGDLKKGEKQAFVDAVNKLMTTANYCFVIKPDDVTAKLLYLNTTSSENGDIQFQLTTGHKRGFANAAYEIIPYIRPYTKK